MKIGILLVLVLGGFSLAAQSAQVFKWVDADGKVHYSDQPVAGKAEPSKMIIDDRPLSGAEDAASASQKLSEKDAEFRKRKEKEAADKAKSDKAEAAASEKRQNCERARNALRQVQAGGRLAHINARGERELMDDAARAQAVSDAQKSVDSWCK